MGRESDSNRRQRKECSGSIQRWPNQALAATTRDYSGSTEFLSTAATPSSARAYPAVPGYNRELCDLETMKTALM